MVSGGTDNHVVLLDLRGIGMTGKVADLLVSEVNITANKNTVPFDPESPFRDQWSAPRHRSTHHPRLRRGRPSLEVADVIADRLLNPEDSCHSNSAAVDRVASSLPAASRFMPTASSLFWPVAWPWLSNGPGRCLVERLQDSLGLREACSAPWIVSALLIPA